MRYFAEQRGYDPEFWGIVGLLHDIDFEQWPEQHCVKASELLREGGADESIIHAVCSHGWATAETGGGRGGTHPCGMQPWIRDHGGYQAGARDGKAAVCSR